jgi:hypothetical protein
VGAVEGTYVAVTAVFAAGIVSVVLDALALATLAPVQAENVCPAGAAFALMPTTVPAV